MLVPEQGVYPGTSGLSTNGVFSFLFFFFSQTTIEQAGTEQVLIPTFLDLPDQEISEHGGFFGALAENTHALYEEFPAIGVLAEILRVSISDAAPGDYGNVLTPGNLTVNQNFCGYKPLVNRRAEAKNPFLNVGVTADVFLESIPNTVVSYAVVQMMSTWLRKSETFKLYSVDLTHSEVTGSNSQTILEKPVITEM